MALRRGPFWRATEVCNKSFHKSGAKKSRFFCAPCFLLGLKSKPLWEIGPELKACVYFRMCS